MKTPNYHDFYEMAFVPIGFNDRTALMNTDSYDPDADFTHWLIAVEGILLPQPRIYFHWRVSIYPADYSGHFNWKKPFYCSESVELIDHAISLASSLVAASKKDQLYSTSPLEKIM